MAKNPSVYPDWTEAQKGKVHEALFQLINDNDQNSSGTSNNTASLDGISKYTGSPYASINGASRQTDIDRSQQLGSNNSKPTASLNLTAAIIDTLVAKLSSIKIIPKAITNKGNAKGRKLADDLNDIITGVCKKYNVGHLLNMAMRDAMVNRVGYIKVVKEKNKKKTTLKVERIMANEVLVDLNDGYYNDPYKMVHRKVIPISVACKMFPKFEQQINDAHVIEVRQSANTKTYTPCIMIAEAWCKNTYIDGGKHVIAIETATILDEDYDKDYFPIIKVDYNEPMVGWLGMSLIEELSPIQVEIDRIMASLQAIMKLVSVPRVFYDVNSNMNPDHFTNKVGIMIGMDLRAGVPPVIHNGNGVPPELPKQLEFLVSQMYARAGLTQMDTQGQAPMGLESGEALKTMGDIKSERWQLLKNNYEELHIKLVEVILKEMSEHDIAINTMDKMIGLKEIRSSIIPKDFNSFVLQVMPVSSLPTDAAGKIDTVERWVMNGWVDKDSAAELLQMPDLESYVSIQTAPRTFIELSIEEMLETGEYIIPEMYDNLDYAIMYAQKLYAWERMNKADEKSLKLLRRYINDAQKLLAQSTPVAQPQQPQAGVQQSGKPSNNGGNTDPTRSSQSRIPSN